jgi:excisionase family DNA binding protein
MSEPRINAIAKDESDAQERALGTGPLTTRDVARLLGLSERSVRRAITRGELAASKQRGRLVITTEALEDFRHRHSATRPVSERPQLTLVPKPAAPVVPFPGARHPSADTLPTPLTRFVGRETEMEVVAALLQRDDVRLLTLTGPGGAGKTRLALQVASRLAPEFPDGAAFVPLAAVRDPNLVAATIALALDVRGGEDKTPLERLRLFLRDRRLLLLLDNFEQVRTAGPMLAEVLTGCPEITVLVTSRAALHLSGERVFAVPPLALPGKHGSGRHGQPLPPLAELAEAEAVRLFIDRAEIAAGAFTLTQDNARPSSAFANAPTDSPWPSSWPLPALRSFLRGSC